MNTAQTASVPLITNAAGDVDFDFYFSFDDDVEVYKSCSIMWGNEVYVYGGDSQGTQISKITDCRLERVGELALKHRFGDCVNVADELIYLCFDDYNTKRCRVGSSPIGQFNDEITPSNYSHQWTRIATNNGELKKRFQAKVILISDVIIAVGSGSPDHTNAELLSVNDNIWEDIDKYPFVMGLTLFSIFKIIS